MASTLPRGYEVVISCDSLRWSDPPYQLLRPARCSLSSIDPTACNTQCCPTTRYSEWVHIFTSVHSTSILWHYCKSKLPLTEFNNAIYRYNCPSSQITFSDYLRSPSQHKTLNFHSVKKRCQARMHNCEKRPLAFSYLSICPFA